MTQKKRIYNPRTKAYYKRREKTTYKGKRGQIMGIYKSKRQKKKKSIWDL